MRFYHCPYLDDSALSGLEPLASCLKHLELISCADITDQGLIGVIGRLRYECFNSVLLLDIYYN